MKRVSAIQKSGFILGPKGNMKVRTTISSERGKNITAVCSVSVSGNIPAMLI